MKFGLRTPSLKGRLSARLSVKRMIRAKVRVPRGMGLIANPKKAIYNRVYNRTSFSVDRLFKVPGKNTKTTNSALSLKVIGGFLLFCLSIAVWPIGIVVVGYLLGRYFRKNQKSPEVQFEPLATQITTEVVSQVDEPQIKTIDQLEEHSPEDHP